MPDYTKPHIAPFIKSNYSQPQSNNLTQITWSGQNSDDNSSQTKSSKYTFKT